MTLDYLLLIPLVIALAIGWFLGRREWRKQRLERFKDSLKEEYFTGLTHLVDNDTDQAIESFVRALNQNSATVPIQLALGALYRRRGEIQRAIEIHEQVLSVPDLTGIEYSQAQLALSRDYLTAGLLDRSEDLLLQVMDSGGGEQREFAASLLVDIYQQEKEWDKALDIAQKIPHNPHISNKQLAHFYCEMAENALAKHQYKEVRMLTRQALSRDRYCVRANLILAHLEIAEKHWKNAIRVLKEIGRQDPAFVSEAVTLMARCYRHLQANDELIRFLESTMDELPSTTALLLIAEEIAERQGDYAAGAYITEQLKHRPSIKGFNRLIDLHLKYASESAKESLNVLRGLTGQLEQSKPRYCCDSCGFSGQTLHWQCPGCKSWGTVKPIQGLEGE